MSKGIFTKMNCKRCNKMIGYIDVDTEDWNLVVTGVKFYCTEC